MNAAIAMVVEMTVRWRVIGYEIKTYQACQGAPVQPGGTCQKCGQGIKYVFRVKSTAGEVMEVGSDCAITLEGGVELADMRRAEREYEREQYLKSPEYARECTERMARKERMEILAESNARVHAFAIAGLRTIVSSPKCSDWERNYAAGKLRGFESGTTGEGLNDEELLTCWKALRNALAAESTYVGAVGQRDKKGCLATLEAIIPVGADSMYGPKYLHKFRTEGGDILTWFASGSSGAGRDDVGKTFRIVGTVKEHSEFRGVKQTVLTRCKLTQ